jgi:hypothetical protein
LIAAEEMNMQSMTPRRKNEGKFRLSQLSEIFSITTNDELTH